MAATKTVAQATILSNQDEQGYSATLPITPRHGVITLYGYGISARVENGHLALQDGVGTERRAGRFSRLDHGIHRLVVIGSDGAVSLSALRWLADQKAAFVMLDRDGTVLLTTGPVVASDARMRRAQALLGDSEASVSIARELIARKLKGQEYVAREKLKSVAVADAIAECWTELAEAFTLQKVKTQESRAAKLYWSAWRDLLVAFPTRDLLKIPEHWKTFGMRNGIISASPRYACTPGNAMLNYLYAVLESETRLTVVALGLDPGFGLIHVDSANRDSLVYDLMEPIRPKVDAMLADWLLTKPLKREWFFEQRDGICRLMPALVSQLSESAKIWELETAPLAEWYAAAVCSASRPQTRLGPGSRITRANWKVSQGLGQAKHLNIAEVPQPDNLCKTCGAVISRYHSYCTGCAVDESKASAAEKARKARITAHTPEAAAKRRESMRRRFVAEQSWNPADLPGWLTNEVYATQILPELCRIPKPIIAEALGISLGYVAQLRTGIYIPHKRFWKPLADLTGIAET